VPGKYVAGARKVCRGRHGARGRRVGQAWCNVMRILRLDVTTIIACNVRRMVRSDPSAGGFFLEHRVRAWLAVCVWTSFQCVCVCGRVFANRESSGNEYLCVRHVRND
jgi:hypothetical protein